MVYFLVSLYLGILHIAHEYPYMVSKRLAILNYILDQNIHSSNLTNMDHIQTLQSR